MISLIRLLKSTEFKIFLRFACFWVVFAACFAVMFAMLFAAVIGVTFGVIMAIFGTAVLLFRADFVISGIAPEIMLFGGMTVVFLAFFLGMLAVKLGFLVSRFFLRTRRHCDRLRECEQAEQNEPDEHDEPDEPALNEDDELSEVRESDRESED